MPITSLSCSKCKDPQPLSHFAETSCGVEVAHPDFVAAVLAHEAAQPTDKVRVTSGLGCPRSAAIMIAEDVAIDPCALNSPLTGTAWHALMEQNGVTGTVEIEVSGVLDGMPVTGHIDSVIEMNGMLWIADHKHANDFNRKYLNEPKEAHMVQLSIYAELYQQTFGYTVHECALYYHFTTNPPFIIHCFRPWPIEECLDYRPHDGGYRVRDLYAQMCGFLGEPCQRCVSIGWIPVTHETCPNCKGTGRISTPWQELPLVGKEFAFGTKTGCDYCAVRHVCWEEKSGAPF